MTESMVLQLWRDAAVMMLMLAAPLLGVSLVVGLIVSIFQAMTQINEMTLTYIPKLVAIGLVLALLGPWMLAQMLRYLAGVLNSLPALAG
ncbi:MAG: flagellar biosynthesis protein FliQ [Anaerolineae bacterium]